MKFSSRLSFQLIGYALECLKIAPYVSVKVVHFEMTEYLLIFFMPRSSHIEKDDGLAVTGEDFKHLTLLVDKRDGGLPWRHMMDRSTHDMSYQAWIREPEVLF